MLAYSQCCGLVQIMQWDSASSDVSDLAARIAGFQKDELDKFYREHIRRRDLHRVVANLNASALSSDNPRSATARQALKKLGFPD